MDYNTIIQVHPLVNFFNYKIFLTFAGLSAFFFILILYMTTEQIEKFLSSSHVNTANPVKITFKTRKPLEGLFIKTQDYTHLKSKNFWRIVTGGSINDYKTSNDISLARIFNGAEITKLAGI